MTFISIHSVIICCLLWRMYEMHLALFLKAGCDIFAREGIRVQLVDEDISGLANDLL